MADIDFVATLRDAEAALAQLRAAMVGGLNADRATSVFVCYRRSDVPHAAFRIRDHLTSDLGDGAVFIDLHAVEPGSDIVARIDAAMSTCVVLLVVIGVGWLSAQRDVVGRDLDRPEDHVRREIEEAIELGLVILPVLIDAAAMPLPGDLPPTLQPLARRSAVRVRLDSFRADCAIVSSAVRRAVTGHPDGPLRLVADSGPLAA